MSTGGFIVEVEKTGPAVFATIILPPDEEGGDPERMLLATINRSVWERHPEIEAIFNEHMRKLLEVIVGSFGGTVDSMVKVPDGADVEKFVDDTMAAHAASKGH